MLITNQIELDLLLKKLQEHKSLAIDTEFVRRTTYYPKLSIIQICDAQGNIYILDAVKTDISGFNEILQNEKILKIFHAPMQDFEIFYIHFKSLPVNIFDTQTAAKFCDFRSSTSYSELCNAICNVQIDKTQQQSDWLQRPLTDLMIEYAMDDVKYLHKIYHHLSPKIKNQKDYEEEIANLLAISNYKLNPQSAWKKIKCRTNCNSIKSRHILADLAAFREEIAASLDVPRSHFISDESLVTICKTLPTKESELNISRQRTNWISDAKYKQKLFNLCAALK